MEFISGPQTFESFDDILGRTMEFNPTRTESSLRRGSIQGDQPRELARLLASRLG